MYTEVVLNPEAEDPVELVVVQDVTKNNIFNRSIPKKFCVEHIKEARGTRHVIKSWIIEIDY